MIGLAKQTTKILTASDDVQGRGFKTFLKRSTRGGEREENVSQRGRARGHYREWGQFTKTSVSPLE